jgi:hypothetical protein
MRGTEDDGGLVGLESQLRRDRGISGGYAGVVPVSAIFWSSFAFIVATMAES